MLTYISPLTKAWGVLHAMTQHEPEMTQQGSPEHVRARAHTHTHARTVTHTLPQPHTVYQDILGVGLTELLLGPSTQTGTPLATYNTVWHACMYCSYYIPGQSWSLARGTPA